MQFGVVTILLDATAQDELLLDYIYALVKNHQARLHVSWIDSAPDHNFVANQGLHSELSRQLINKNIHKKQGLEQYVKVFFENWCRVHNIPFLHHSSDENMVENTSITASFESRIGELYAQVSHAGRLGDYMVMSCSQWQKSKEIEAQIHAAIYASSCPVLLLPKNCMVRKAENIAIAWNDSKEVARAVKNALPLLKQVKNVYIYTSPSEHTSEDSSQELQDYLTHHEIAAKICFIDRNFKQNVSETMLLQAQKDNIDLFVMGASVSKVLGRLNFGRMTRQMLALSTIPLFMAS